MKFHQEKKGKKWQCLVIDKLVDGERETENELDISNCFNINFWKLGLYKGKNVRAPNIFSG